MSIYEELSAAARDLLARDDQFYAAAIAFPGQLRTALAARLEVPEDMLGLRGVGNGPARQWPPLAASGLADRDEDGYFTFAITIMLLTPGLSDMVPLTPVFCFQPVRDGFDVQIGTATLGPLFGAVKTPRERRCRAFAPVTSADRRCVGSHALPPPFDRHDRSLLRTCGTVGHWP